MTKRRLNAIAYVGYLSLAVCISALYLNDWSKCAIAPCQHPSTQSKTDISSQQLRLKAQAITVKVMSDEFLGSGILFKKDKSIYTVITNAHVLRAGDPPYRIQTPDGHVYAARVSKNSNFGKNDLAILQFQSHEKDYTILAIGSKPVLGDQIFAAGFYSQENEEKQSFNLTIGKVSLLLPQPLENGYQIGYTNDIQKGMSGGPLLNRRGEVLGVNGMHANPLWDTPSVFVDGSYANQALHEQINRFSWAIPIEKLINFK